MAQKSIYSSILSSTKGFSVPTITKETAALALGILLPLRTREAPRRQQPSLPLDYRAHQTGSTLLVEARSTCNCHVERRANGGAGGRAPAEQQTAARRAQPHRTHLSAPAANLAGPHSVSTRTLPFISKLTTRNGFRLSAGPFPASLPSTLPAQEADLDEPASCSREENKREDVSVMGARRADVSGLGRHLINGAPYLDVGCRARPIMTSFLPSQSRQSTLKDRAEVTVEWPIRSRFLPSVLGVAFPPTNRTLCEGRRRHLLGVVRGLSDRGRCPTRGACGRLAVWARRVRQAALHRSAYTTMAAGKRGKQTISRPAASSPKYGEKITEKSENPISKNGKHWILSPFAFFNDHMKLEKPSKAKSFSGVGQFPSVQQEGLV
ncbi:Phosphatidylinositol 4-phosphate 3-kinase C2 domain-containing subunit alpha [Varanus komodoensis]|nr:Phosphatidylinositol 4-phosphate 3-kinase C2 domain-containing subunit alpha [Varanus komodoensis]